ncbi:DEAD/DEAH box helicase [Patescibacteria group bacterium]|nr:MAG: DEAD/DEAH box helicase [Patescibacteria group bacterium]
MHPQSFSELGLPDLLLKNIAAAGYEAPTPIQAQAIPPGMLGRDVVGIAQTGTGKTAAFALPMLMRLAGKKGTVGLILAPTRELALQIDETLAKLAKGVPLRRAVIIGGAGMNPQTAALRSGVSIVIATPGRLIDHLERRTTDMSKLEMVVLDEADRMLDMGFWPQIRRIFSALPKQRQTMLFSATMLPEVAQLANQQLHDPVRVEIARTGTTAEGVTQRIFFADDKMKVPLLLWLLGEEPGTVLVFTRTKHRADKVARLIANAGHKVERIHSNRSLNQRLRALEGFKTGKHRVLVATDIAARGIDVANIAHIVNFDLPSVAEDYVHRIGRTARAAATGRATSFVAPDQRKLLGPIERLIRQQIPVAPLPEGLQASAGASAMPPDRQQRRFQQRPMAPTHRSDMGAPQRPGSQGFRRGQTPSGPPDESWGFMPGTLRGKRKPQFGSGRPGGERRYGADQRPRHGGAEQQPPQIDMTIPGTGAFWETRRPIGPAPGARPGGRGGNRGGRNNRSGGGNRGGRGHRR